MRFHLAILLVLLHIPQSAAAQCDPWSADCAADGCLLYTAIHESRLDTLSELLKRGVDPNTSRCPAAGQHQSTPLELAVRKGNTDAIALLAQNGALFPLDLEAEDMQSLRSAEVLKKLIAEQALPVLDALRNAGLLDLSQLNCSRHASWYGIDTVDIAGLRELSRRGLPWQCAPIEKVVATQNMPMLEFILRMPDESEGRKELIEQGAAIAVQRSDMKMLKYFLELGADASPHLKQAVLRREHHALHLLLRFGGDPNFVMSGESKSPLAYAAQYGNDRAVQLLLKHGASLNSLDEQGRTPLALLVANVGYFSRPGKRGAAPAESAYQAARMLIRFGTDLELRDKHGKTVLEAALESYQHPLSRRLVQDFLVSRLPQGVSYSGLLRQYACSGNEQLIDFLLSRDADPFERGANGKAAVEMRDSPKCYFRQHRAMRQDSQAATTRGRLRQ